MNNEPVELSFFSDAIIRRWYLPVGFALLAVLIGLQLRPEPGPPLYEAQAKVLIRPVTNAVFDSNLRVDQIINSDTEAQLASSQLVARSTLEFLGDEAPSNLGVEDIATGLEVEVRTDSQIVVIRYQHANPDIAGAISDAVATTYLTTRSQAAVDEKTRQANQLATQISDLTRDLTTANITIATAETERAERESLESRIRRLEEVVAIQALEGTESEIIGDPIGALSNRLDALNTTIEPAELASAKTTVDLIGGQIANLRDELIKLLTLEIDGGSVIQRAGVGIEVLPANQMILPAIGALVGLMIGIAAAVTIERAVRSRAASHRTPTATAAPATPGPHGPPVHAPAPTPEPAWTPPPEPTTVPVEVSSPSAGEVTQSPLPHAETPHLSNGHAPARAPAESNGHTLAPIAQSTGTVTSTRPLPNPATWGRRPEAPKALTSEAATQAPTTEEAEPPETEAAAQPPETVAPPTPEAVAPPTPETVAPPTQEAVLAPPVVAAKAPEPAPAAEQLRSPQPNPAPNTVAAIADIAKIPRSAREPVVVTAPDSEPATGLRAVAHLIQNETAGAKTPSIMITSAKAHEGRTTVATNVAASLRQDGLNVLLITDAYDRVIAPDVHILPPGMHLGPDLTFPDSKRLGELLDEARGLLDIVIIDGPPALIDGEAKRLAKLVDAAVIVAVSGRTSAADVAATKNWLEEAGTRILGLVTTTRPSWLVRRIGDRSVNNGAGTED